MSTEEMKMPQQPVPAVVEEQPHIAAEQPSAQQPMSMSLRGGDDDGIDGGDICCGLCAAFACYECCKCCC